MKTLVNRYYYSFAELAEATGPFTSITSFPAMLKRIYDGVPTSSPTQIEQNLFTKYLWPEFYESPIFYFDVEQKPWEAEVEPELEDVQEAAEPLVGRLYRWYTESVDRYDFLISQLESIKNTLLGPVKVVSSASGTYSGTVSGNGTNTGTVKVESTTGETSSTHLTGTVTGSGTNTGTVQVETNTGDTSSTHVTGTVTGSGTNTGTVQVADSTNSTTTVNSTTTRKESDTPQSGIQSLLDGYVSKAAQEIGNSTTGVTGSGTSTTTNNLANSTTSSTDNTTTVTASGTASSTTTNNLANSTTSLTDNTTAVTASGTVESTTTNNLANSNSSTNSGNTSDSSTVSNDFDTPIERFREIQEKLRNLYADWANEFSKFVLQSAE